MEISVLCLTNTKDMIINLENVELKKGWISFL